jgi:hypothetical protein
MTNYFDDNDTMTAEVAQALQALPPVAREYLIDLITVALGERFLRVPENWAPEWSVLRTTLGGTLVLPYDEDEPEDDELDDELVELLDAELEDELQAGADKEKE